jgi:hypothetical protein
MGQDECPSDGVPPEGYASIRIMGRDGAKSRFKKCLPNESPPINADQLPKSSI